MIETKGEFYLGRIVDPATNKLTDKPLLYDPADLTTHAFVVGMTGSGKTGLCVGMLEEAALNNIPALMIDPKGDITNLLLHFPDLLPADFQPWINADQARRAGQTLEQAAEEAATNWKKGLADWDISSERIKALKESVQFSIFTPGSDAGIPVSILASLKAPEIPWEGNRETLREQISSTVTALLGLVGMNDVDPVRSREHILLSNVFEHAWSQGKDLDLGELILQTQSPPFEKLGVFDVNAFFPEKDRFSLAMLLNNILAAPAFQTWIEGEPLDIPALLYTPDGQARHSVFYIAHLSEAERMFFVTLLFSAFESWMRSQSGTTTLRALLYFDEIFGYLPPISNPPSKQPMLRMLKQARAFGVGLVLVTQNPVDVDYKGISNTGTWFIGKLQTDQDKQRLLDGLEGVLGEGQQRSTYDKLISSLGKRVFLMHNVHNKQPLLMQTRWVMNYLAGPLTRAQIPTLNALAGAKHQSEKARPAADRESNAAIPPVAETAVADTPVTQKATSGQVIPQASSTRPPVPGGVNEYFLPNNLTFSEALKMGGPGLQSVAASPEMLYRPALLAQSKTLFLNRKYNLDYELAQAAIVVNPDRRGAVRWEDFPAAPIDARQLDERPAPQARFSSLDAPLADVKILAALQKDFVEWAYRSTRITVRANESLKVYAGPDVSQADFRQMCAAAARKLRDDEIAKVEAAYEKKLVALQDKLKREQRELDQDESELSQRTIEEVGRAAETVFGLFAKRKSSRNISSSLTKRRMTSQAKADVKESKDAIADMEKQLSGLEKEKAQAIAEVESRWGEVASRDEEIALTPLKKDIHLEIFGVAWFPYYLIRTDLQTTELPAYRAE